MRRAEHLAGQRQIRVAVQLPGQAEVGHAGLILRVEEDLRGLEVAVQDAAFVRVMNRSRGALEIRGGLLVRQGTVPHDFRQALARNVVHGEEMPAFMDADFVDDHEV
jgi:hypothetical protein